MKKKILIVSLVVNIIAGAFVFYSFTSKAKNVNDEGGYMIMNVYHVSTPLYKSEISITDGKTILEQIDLESGWVASKQRENNKTITNKINEIQSKGYGLVSSNSASDGGYMSTNYIFVKK